MPRKLFSVIAPAALLCLLLGPLASVAVRAQDESGAGSAPQVDKGAEPTRLPVSEASPRKVLPREITFSFDDADWTDVLKWLAQLSDRALLVQDSPGGKFTYFDNRKYSFPEALDVINSVLLNKGFAVLTRDNFLIVANVEDIPPHLVERIEVEDLPNRGRTEFVKVLITLEGMVAEQAKKDFDATKGPHGTIVALPSTNQLLIVDTAKTVQQIVDIIDSIEKGDGSASLKAFPLKYVSALEVERVVRDLLGLKQRDAQTPAASATANRQQSGESRRDMFRRMFGGRPRGGRGGGRGGGGDSAQQRQPQSQQQAPTPAAGAKGPFVSIDERTNTLFVTATPEKLALVNAVVLSLDVKMEDNGEGLVDQMPRIEVYPVAAGTAEGMAKVLETVFQRSPDTKVSAHPDGHSLIVLATSREHRRIGEVIGNLKTEGIKVEVIQLRRLEAETTARLIKSLLGLKTEDNQTRTSIFSRFRRGSSSNDEEEFGPAIEADVERNRLLVRGSETQVAEVRDLLAKMGETGVAASDSGLPRSRYRVFPTGEQDPREFAESIQRIWTRINPKTPIRIVDTSAPAQPFGSQGRQRGRDRRGPSPNRLPDEEPPGDKSPQGADKPSPGDAEPTDKLDSCGYEEPASDEKKEPTPPEPPARLDVNVTAQPSQEGSEGTQASKPTEPEPITIVIGPENLAIASNDTEALDMLDNLINSMARGTATTGTGFGIYYLEWSDASEMALTIDEALYGQQTIFSVTDSSTQARILPDTRTNSLLVVGPAGEQRKIQQMLEVLDQPEPEFAMASTPDTIQVDYAKAADLAQVVREVFAAQLYEKGQQNQRQSGGFNPFASSRGRSGSGAGSARGKLTVGVDEQTNQIVVSAPRRLFEQVKALVESLDNAARNNQRTAKVVSLRNAKPEAVRAALGGLLGVKTADAKGKTSNESATRNQPGNPEAGQQPNGRFQGSRNGGFGGGGGRGQSGFGGSGRRSRGGDRGGRRGGRSRFSSFGGR